jgi:hypothetical protein
LIFFLCIPSTNFIPFYSILGANIMGGSSKGRGGGYQRSNQHMNESSNERRRYEEYGFRMDGEDDDGYIDERTGQRMNGGRGGRGGGCGNSNFDRLMGRGGGRRNGGGEDYDDYGDDEIMMGGGRQRGGRMMSGGGGGRGGDDYDRFDDFDDYGGGGGGRGGGGGGRGGLLRDQRN